MLVLLRRLEEVGTQKRKFDRSSADSCSTWTFANMIGTIFTISYLLNRQHQVCPQVVAYNCSRSFADIRQRSQSPILHTDQPHFQH